MKKLYATISISVFSFGLFFCAKPAYAYEINTHMFLTKDAIEFYSEKAATSTVRKFADYIIEGSRKEDDVPRWMNHFYDPINDRGLTYDPKIDPALHLGTWNESKVWAVNSDTQNELKYKIITGIASILSVIQQKKLSNFTTETDFAWQRAIELYADGRKEDAFLALGHILHLIQDTSVPDHTRNDPHPEGSIYERWAGQFTIDNPDDDLLQKLENKNFITKDNLGLYFDELATYSNNNFYSKDTIGVQSGYSSPQPSFFTKTTSGNFAVNMDSNGRDYYLYRKIGDDSYLIENSFSITINDEKVTNDYWSLLSPKAVQYSASVIDLFLKEAEKAREEKLSQKEDIKKSYFGQAMDLLSGLFSFGKDQGLKLAATVDLNEERIEPENYESQTVVKKSDAVKIDDASGEFISLQDFINDTQDEDAITDADKIDDLTEVNDASIERVADIVEQKPVQVCKFATDKSPLRQKLIINELAWMGGIGSANDEWIELRNISGGELDISGWQLLDKEEQIKLTFGRNTKIGNGGYILLERTDDDSVPEIKADAIYAGALSNSDEGLRLYDSECNLSDEIIADSVWSFGDAAARRTMERLSDLSWHTYNGGGITLGGMLVLGTPKQENSQLAVTSTSVVVANSPAANTPAPAAETVASEIPVEPKKLLISEIQITGGTGKSNNDFIEIYNPNSAQVNLNGYRLVKRTKTGTTDSSIKSWTSDAYIPAQGYYLWANSDYATISAAPDVTTSATISNDNGLAIRYGAEDTGTVIDSIGWGAAANSFVESRVFSENSIANQSISRIAEIDGNDNAADFMKSRPSPKNSSVSGGFIAPIDWNSQSAAPSDHVLISEVYPDRTGANQDFVELYNPNPPEDISGWSLQILSANATSTDRITKKNFVSGNQIPESGFFLVGLDDYVGGDMNWASGSLNSTSGATIFLVKATTTIESFDDPKIIDRIAYGSGDGSVFPESSAAALPEIGNSLERRGLKDGFCIIATDAGEFIGNGCDTDDNSADFKERSAPNPQSSANLIEPRTAPAAIQNFSASYSTTTMQISLAWDESQDFNGASSTVRYYLSYSTSTPTAFKDLAVLSATAFYAFRINEVGMNYDFSIIAKDQDGLASESSEISLVVPSIFRNAYLYVDPRNTEGNLLELEYDSYPFVDNPYWDGDSWLVLIAYKNQEPQSIPYFYSDQQYASEPEDSPIKQYGEWGKNVEGAWKLNYANCAGSSTNAASLILPDTAEQCSANFGGARNSSLSIGLLEDSNLIIPLSAVQPAPIEGDYLTFGIYGYNGFNTQRLLATDRFKYNFQAIAPEHLAPVIGGELSLNFSKSDSRLETGWEKATDTDTRDAVLKYEISYDAGENWESLEEINKAVKIVAPGQSFSILVRAKDDFGNYSEPLSASWSYPETIFYVTQTESNKWGAEFGTKNPNCPSCFGTASLQSIQPETDFEFNAVTLKLMQETVSDWTNFSLAAYPDLNGLPDFSVLLGEAQLGGILRHDPAAEISFVFDNPVAFSAGVKYWLVLSVNNYGDNRGYFRNIWKNAINSGSDAYTGGQAGQGTSGVCNNYCTFTVPYPDATADWYMKIGRTQ